MGLLRFFCDESYDSAPKRELAFYPCKPPAHTPKAYVVGGVLANEPTWRKIADRFTEENKRAGVSRLHASQVNALEGEFEDWSKDQQIEYSKNLLAILREQKREIHVISIGMFPREYEQTINEVGRQKLGHPYIACFKSCVALIAQEMELRKQFQPEDKFAVILDRNEHETDAVEIFYKLKDTTSWPYHRRLATCAPGGWEDHVELQAADLVAYETFRILGEKYEGRDQARKTLKSLFSTNGFLGYYFEPWAFKQMKYDLENCGCVPNGYVVNFPPPADEEQQDE